MRVGLDVLGGDFAPEANVLGAIAAQRELGDRATIVLYGDVEVIRAILQKEGVDPNMFDVVHTNESIGMGNTLQRPS